MSEPLEDAIDVLQRESAESYMDSSDLNKPLGLNNQVNRVGGSVLHVAAVATHLERYMPLLVQSSARLGVNLEVLGWGEKLTGFAFRLQKTLDYVETLPPDDVVLFIDAFDVVLLQNAEVILKKFHASGAEMVISKDGEHPNAMIDFFIKRVFRPVGDTYINIGCYLGRCGFIRDLMRELFKFGEGFTEKENDQELMARYLATNKHLVGKEILIDHNNDLFLNLYGGERFWVGSNKYKLVDHRKDIEILKDGSLHYLKTDSWPCLVHGPANTDLTEILDKLGYQLPPNLDKNYTSLTHFSYLTRMFSHYWKYLYTIAIQILLVVVALVIVGYLIHRWRNNVAAAANAPPDPLAQRNIRLVPYSAVPMAQPAQPRAYFFQANPAQQPGSFTVQVS